MICVTIPSAISGVNAVIALIKSISRKCVYGRRDDNSTRIGINDRKKKNAVLAANAPIFFLDILSAKSNASLVSPFLVFMLSPCKYCHFFSKPAKGRLRLRPSFCTKLYFVPDDAGSCILTPSLCQVGYRSSYLCLPLP